MGMGNNYHVCGSINVDIDLIVEAKSSSDAMGKAIDSITNASGGSAFKAELSTELAQRAKQEIKNDA